jgi:hypothetical protein
MAACLFENGDIIRVKLAYRLFLWTHNPQMAQGSMSAPFALMLCTSLLLEIRE